MSKARIYIKEVTQCGECPALSRSYLYWNLCIMLDKTVTTAIHAKKIDKRCPLEKVKK